MSDPAANASIFAPFEWMIALRYLRARRKEGFVSVISGFSLVGIAFGVAALIIVMSVMGGFRQELLASVLGFNSHITAQTPMGPLSNFDAIAAKLRKVAGVTRAVPIVDGQAMARSGNMVYVRGMRSGDLASLTAVASTLSPSALQAFRDQDAVIVGKRLADNLGINIGGSITLMTVNGKVTDSSIPMITKTYLVTGFFRNSIYDSSFVFMPLEEAQLFFNTGNGVTGIQVMVENPEDDLSMLPALHDAAGRNVRLVRWQDVDSARFSAIQVEKIVMFLILTLIILVAVLNIVSGLVMLVNDKSADIAVLRTMGASRGAVMRVFLIAGMSIGVISTIVGFILGVAFCLNIARIGQGLSGITGAPTLNSTLGFLSNLPVVVNPSEVISVVAMALTLTFLATLYPSWRAARLNPIEALRDG